MDARLGSVLNPSISNTTILDTFSKSMSTGYQHGFSAFPLFSPHTLAGKKDKISVADKGKSQFVGATKGRNIEAPKTDSDNSESFEPMVGAVAKPPVVLPTYLMNDEDAPKKNNAVPTNKVTRKQLIETAALRNEIKYAVKNHIYAHTGAESARYRPDEETPPQPEYENMNNFNYNYNPPMFPRIEVQFDQFKDFFAFLDAYTGKAANPSFQSEKLGDARSDFSFVSNGTQNSNVDKENQFQSYHSNRTEMLTDEDFLYEQMMANAAAKTKDEGINSNTVESYVNNVERPIRELSQVRETLDMRSITEDFRFKIGENVIEWKTLQRMHHEAHALIGLTKSSIVLALEKNGKFELQAEVPLMSPKYFTTVTYFNQTKNAVQGIVIVGTAHEIVFLRINEAMNKMESFWMWPTYKSVKYIEYFEIDNAATLLLLTNTSVNLYRFDFKQLEFYLRESLSIKHPAKEVALIQSGHETFICIPQISFVIIYKYEQNRFKYFAKIDAENVETVSGFEMGGYSYIAVGGNQAKILRYHRGSFHVQTIFAKSWGFVEYFLPVAARTYRDDLILFVQHRISYSTHSNSYLEALIWNGVEFNSALSVPCYVNGRESDIGMGCMLDLDRELGIAGATVFQRNRTISILVPRLDAPSGLFELEIVLLPGKLNC